MNETNHDLRIVTMPTEPSVSACAHWCVGHLPLAAYGLPTDAGELEKLLRQWLPNGDHAHTGDKEHDQGGGGAKYHSIESEESSVNLKNPGEFKRRQRHSNSKADKVELRQSTFDILAELDEQQCRPEIAGTLP